MNYYKLIEENCPEIILKELYNYLVDKVNIPDPKFEFYFDKHHTSFKNLYKFNNYTVYLNEIENVSVYIDNVIVLRRGSIAYEDSYDITRDVEYFFKHYKYLRRTKIINEIL